jgi:ABC-type uncharacterized transport system auxiliary subunit
MVTRPTGSPAALRRIVCVLAVAAALAGCDRCGDFASPWKFQSQACRDEAPKPQ